MLSENPQVVIRTGRRPIQPVLVPFPTVCFVGGLLTDIAYWRTAEMMWADFSAWLLTVGLIMGVLAAIAGVVDFLRKASQPVWLHALLIVLVLVLALFDTLVHSRDAWTSVVPTGLALSAVVVLILPFTGWLGRSWAYRDRARVTE